MNEPQKQFSLIIERLANEYPSKEAFTFLRENKEPEIITFSQVLIIIKEINSILINMGITAGDRVAIISKTSPYAFITSVALSYLNVATVFIDPELPSEEIDRLISFSDVRGIFTNFELYVKLSVQIRNEILSFNISSINSRIICFNESIKRNNTVTEDKDLDIIAILYSSGTTSVSKGVMMTFSSALRAHEIFFDIYNIKPETRLMVPLPVNHISGYLSTMVYFLSGNSVGMAENLNSNRLQKCLLEYNPHHFVMIPKVYELIAEKIRSEISSKPLLTRLLINSLLKTSKFLRRLGIKSSLCRPIYSKVFGRNINSLCVLGSICNKETAEFYLDMGLLWANLYAATETGAPITSGGKYDKYPSNSVGNVYAHTGIEIKINNPNSDGVGEIYVNTEMIMKGYFRDPEATAAAFDGKYFKTGDLGYIDSKGYLFLSGRSKDTIALHNGEKVSATDIDDYYRKCVPDMFIACCGITGDDGMDEIYMFIESSRKSSEKLNEAKEIILEKSRQTEERYKISRVYFIDRIPTTSVGKVRRFLLKEQAKEMLVLPKDEILSQYTSTIKDYIISKIIETSGTQNINLNFSLTNDLSFDSLKIFELCVSIENAFGINIMENVPKDITVNDLIRIAEENSETKTKSKNINDRILKSDIFFKKINHFVFLIKLLYKPIVLNQENINLDNSSGIIIAPNHRSTLDPLIITSILRKNVHWAALKRFFEGKDSIFNNNKNPLLCSITQKTFKKMEYFPIERVRDNPEADNSKPISDMKLFLLNNQYIGIFPEGTTRRPENSDFGNFDPLFIALAKETRSLVYPITIFWKTSKRPIVNFGKPFGIEEMSIDESFKKYIDIQSRQLKEIYKYLEK